MHSVPGVQIPDGSVPLGVFRSDSALELLGTGFGCTHLEIRLTAPLAVRGGKNSSENQRSPDSVLRRILSRSLSPRSESGSGVEQRELSLELSPLLLLPPLESLLQACQPPSTRWFTMTADKAGTVRQPRPETVSSAF